MENPILLYSDEEHFFSKLKQCVASVIKDELKLTGEKEKKADEFINMDEVAKLLKITKPTIYRHIELGYYQRKNIGRKVLFSKKEILSFIEKGGSR